MSVSKSIVLAFLVLAISIQSSWTAMDDLIRDIYLQNGPPTTKGPNLNNRAGFNQIPPPASSSFLRNYQDIDERLANVIAKNVLHFGHQIGLQLSQIDPNANAEIFSPLSVMSALSLLMLGAKGSSYQELKLLNGLDSDSEFRENPSKFHKELGLMLSDIQHLNGLNGGLTKRQNALWRDTHVKSSPTRSSNRPKAPVEHIIKVANGLFIQNGYDLNPDYKQIIQSIYDSDVTPLDFQSQSNNEARNYINSWVNKSTFGKIPQIINSQIDKSTNVILASVLYFKAFWSTPFFTRSTKEDYFYPDGLNNPGIKVQMMPTGGVFPFYDAKEYDCRIIGLPYRGNETTMYVIQPNNSTRQKLREMQQLLSAHKINEMIDRMERKTTVMVFPKMHFTRSMTLKPILQSMGIQSIFESSASDLSLIANGRPPLKHGGAAHGTAQFAPPSNALTPNTVPIYNPNNSPIYTPNNAPSYTVPFSSIYRDMPPAESKPHVVDLHEGLVFRSRFGEIDQSTNNTNSTNSLNDETTITTLYPYPAKTEIQPQTREKRQVPNLYRNPTIDAFARLETDRFKTDQYHPDLYVDDIIHKVDFAVDEQGTEAAAATLTYLTRSGTDVVFRGDTPFLIVIRHDPTKLPLFYGIINKPEL